jgi:hypothetical protein
MKNLGQRKTGLADPFLLELILKSVKGTGGICATSGRVAIGSFPLLWLCLGGSSRKSSRKRDLTA